MSSLVLQEALSAITKALLVRNSRFAEEVLANQFSGRPENRIFEYHLRALAELVVRINEEPQLKAYEDLPLLAENVAAMFSDPSSDRLKTAKEIFDRINKDVQVMMKKTPNNVNRGVNLILAANHYVQIAECLILSRT